MNDEIIIEEEIEEEKKDEIEMEGDDVVYKLEKDYNKLDNKPSINNVPLEGNKTLDEFGIQAKGNYVEQEAGKGLSTNDYTTQEKEKLANLENYDDTEIKQDIQDLETNKADRSEIPTDLKDLNDDSTHRLVTDTEKSNWNNKAETSDVANAINTAVGNETTARENSDVRLQNQIDAITSASDVVDVVGTYTELQNYDTTKLTDKDLIKVMQDSTHNNALSYFRWLNNTWSYVGSEGPFYTKSESDTLLNEKQNEINSNNKLASDLVDDTNSGNKFTNTTEKQRWDNKLDEEDLADYVKNTDYATYNKGGTIKTGNGINVYSTGIPYCTELSYSTYINQQGNFFMAKGTLENVIAGKNLETANNKVTEIDENSTDTQYPSAKAVQNSQAEQDENIEANTEEIQNILNMLPKGTATGEEITINDSANYKFNKFGIKGNTEQGENPSPDNPQEVKTVTGDNVVKIVGENLLNPQQVIEDSNKPDKVYINDGYIHFVTGGNPIILKPKKVKENTSYTFKLICNSTSSSTNHIRFIAVYTDGSEVKLSDTTTNSTNEFTTVFSTDNNKTLSYVYSQWTDSVWVKIKIDGSMLLMGNYTAETIPSYEPHQEQLYPLNLTSKNLFDGELELGIIDWNTGANSPNNNAIRSKNYIPIDGNKAYTFSWNNSNLLELRVYEYKDNYEYYRTNAIKINSGGTYIPTTTDIKYIRTFNSGIADTEIKIQIEEGTTATEYEPYYNIEFCEQDFPYKAINGDEYYDSLTDTEKSNLTYGSWYKHKEKGKVVLDGSENWQDKNITDNNILFSTAKIDGLAMLSETNNFKMSHFKPVSTLWNDDVEGFWLFNLSLNLRVRINRNLLSDISTKENAVVSFKTWLTTNNITMYYILETPIEEEITNETVISQLEAIYNGAKSYKGQTHIYTETDGISPIFDVEYYRDLESLFN